MLRSTNNMEKLRSFVQFGLTVHNPVKRHTAENTRTFLLRQFSPALYHRTYVTGSSCNSKWIRLNLCSPHQALLHHRLFGSSPNNGQSQNPRKTEQSQFTISERLKSMEDALRFQGYSTIRIGLAVLVVTAIGVYVFRHSIRENVADEVSNVATMSLADLNVKMKVQELALALVNTILNNPNVQQQAVQFLGDILQADGTRAALVELLLSVLRDPNTQAQLGDSLKHVVQVALDDEAFVERFAAALHQLLRDENTRRSLLELLSYAFNAEPIRREAETFAREVLKSSGVKEQAATLGKSAVREIVSDSGVQRQTGDAMWSAFTYSIKPRIFSGSGHKNNNNNNAKTDEKSGETHNDDNRPGIVDSDNTTSGVRPLEGGPGHDDSAATTATTKGA